MTENRHPHSTQVARRYAVAMNRFQTNRRPPMPRGSGRHHHQPKR